VDDLRASDGTLLWAASLRVVGIVPPTVADGLIFVGTTDAWLYALRASDGAVAWRFQMGQPSGVAPTAVGGRVYVASLDGSLYVLDEYAGTQIARVNLTGSDRGNFLSSPLVADGSLYIGATTNGGMLVPSAEIEGFVKADTLPALTLRWQISTHGADDVAPVTATS
jgi:outer membrane protein assembly factor BamB